MNDPSTVFPRVARLRVRNLRSLRDLDIPLGPLTVLVGDNGSGKTTVIEALSILSTIATFEASAARFALRRDVLREDDGRLRQRASIEAVVDGGPAQASYCYGVVLGVPCAPAHSHAAVDVLVEREGIREITDDHYRPIQLREEIEPSNPYQQVRELLQGVTAQLDRVEPVDRDLSFVRMLREGPLDTFAEYLRLGIGHHLSGVGFDLTVAGAEIGTYLAWNPAHPDTVARRTRLFDLSQGERAYVRAVALLLLGRGIVALDSPDQGLHPGTAWRVADLADIASERRQVVITTHSDPVLDGLHDPRCVLHLERNRLPTRVDTTFYERMQQPYSMGLGTIRRDGYGSSLFAVEEPPAWPGPSILDEDALAP